MMKIAFDIKLMKPGCVLLQAAFGCDRGSDFGRLFPAQTWLVAPTPDLKVYEVTTEQLEQLSQMVQEKHT